MMLPDSDDYLSSDDTDMDESQSSSLCASRPELASLASLASAQKLVAEMDYSLLAVDMQKLLHISRTGTATATGNGAPAEEAHTHTIDAPVSVSLSRRPSIKMNEMEDIPDHRCSFCSGNFTAKDSLSKHMLRVHHKDVVSILSQYSNSRYSDSLKCPYCVYRLSEKHKKLFLLHLEKKHSFELVASIKEHLSSSKDAAAAAAAAAKTGGKGKDKEPWNRLVNNSVRRKLELEPSLEVGSTVAVSAAVSAAAQVLYLKENAPSHRSRNGSRNGRHGLDEESMTNLMWKRSAVKQFVCGRCQQAFSYNALLLDHINVRHRGPLKLVQPLYHCGLCTATFFKNKFLVRHCLHHHSPPQQ